MAVVSITLNNVPTWPIASNACVDVLPDDNDPCGLCEYRRVCGGCRARAYAATGDYLAEEPYCVYKPRRKAVQEV